MKIFLRPVTLDDGKLIVKWRNSDAIRNHCFDKTLVSLESNRRFFENNIETGKYKQFIVNRINDDYGFVSYPIASIYLKDVDQCNARCELCLFTSDDEEWNSESQAVAIKLMLDKAFNVFKMRKVFSYVIEENEDEIQLLLRCGFQKEALLKKEAVGLDGRLLDVMRLSIFKDGGNEEN